MKKILLFLVCLCFALSACTVQQVSNSTVFVESIESSSPNAAPLSSEQVRGSNTNVESSQVSVQDAESFVPSIPLTSEEIAVEKSIDAAEYFQNSQSRKAFSDWCIDGNQFKFKYNLIDYSLKLAGVAAYDNQEYCKADGLLAVITEDGTETTVLQTYYLSEDGLSARVVTYFADQISEEFIVIS